MSFNCDLKRKKKIIHRNTLQRDILIKYISFIIFVSSPGFFFFPPTFFHIKVIENSMKSRKRKKNHQEITFCISAYIQTKVYAPLTLFFKSIFFDSICENWFMDQATNDCGWNGGARMRGGLVETKLCYLIIHKFTLSQIATYLRWNRKINKNWMLTLCTCRQCLGCSHK